MRIEQAYIRPSIYKTFPMFVERFGLQRGIVTNQPLIVFGCYTEYDIRLIVNHQAPVIMVWMGSDFELFGDRRFWNRPNIYHVAIGKWMEEDLKKRGLSYRRVNLIGSPLVDTLKPEPPGDAIYVYLPKKRRDYYGGKLVDEVQRHLDGQMEFIIHTGLDVPQSEMLSVYRKCFVGLRLVKHDGGSETVIEMGLMGRRTIHNGDTPCSLAWSDVDGIVRTLRAQQQLSGSTDAALAQQVRNHIQLTDEWLDLDWWKD